MMNTKQRIRICLLAGLAVALQGCATKSARVVTANQVVSKPVTASQNWAIADAPRTEPGKIMDPEAVTYAQVPSRIIFLPGHGGIFGRDSARQEVAYNLVPVGRQPEAIAPAPEMTNKPAVTEGKEPPPNQFTSVFPDKNGKPTRGIARRLGVLGKTPDEEKRATALLQRDELLRWNTDVGWVGFQPEVEVTVEKAPIKKENIPEIDLGPTPAAPKLFNPNETTEENKKDVESKSQGEEKAGLGELLIE